MIKNEPPTYLRAMIKKFLPIINRECGSVAEGLDIFEDRYKSLYPPCDISDLREFFAYRHREMVWGDLCMKGPANK